MTDNLLKWCAENKMYLFLDMHALPGGQGNDVNISDNDKSKPSLWESEENQRKSVALWKKIAERYKDSPGLEGTILSMNLTMDLQEKSQWLR